MLRLFKDRLQQTARTTDRAIFWGNNESPAANKLHFFQAAAQQPELNIPEFSTDINVAATWRNPTARNVSVAGFARTILTGHSGRGIVAFNNGETTPLPTAPLYVKYIKKSEEYRVHVFAGKVIDIIEKRRRLGFENVNYQIRNVDTGWVYCRDNMDIKNKNELIKQALLACRVSRLDFGAVDILYNSHQDKYYVLEVNTAPGLEGKTVEIYANAIINTLGLKNA